MTYYYPGKFLYLAQPHTGSTAITAELTEWQRQGLGRQVGTHHTRLPALLTQITREVKLHPHLRLHGNEIVWTVVRNPYDLFVTMWLRRKDQEDDFQIFCEQWDKSPYIEDGMLYFHVPDADRILRYEKLPGELLKLTTDLGLPPIEPKRRNVTEDKEPWPTYYTQACLDAVNRRYAKEFEPFYEPIERVEDLSHGT